jgi:dolichyl-phosphate-mannose-protein mannosyltransferase
LDRHPFPDDKTIVTAQPIPSRGGHRIMLAGILLFALLVRLGWGLTRPTSDAALNLLPDQHDYLSLARSVLHGNGFILRDPRFPNDLKAFRTPGYPFFLAACGANVRLARALQALIDTSTILAVYCIARRIIRSRQSDRVPMAAAALVAANPFLIYFSGLLLTETLFTAMLAWAMALLVYASDPDGKLKRVQWLAAGLLLTISVLVRPSGIGLPVTLGVAAVIVSQNAGVRSLASSQRSRHGLEAHVTRESRDASSGKGVPRSGDETRSRDTGFQPVQSDIKDSGIAPTQQNKGPLSSSIETPFKNTHQASAYQPRSFIRDALRAASAMLLLTLLTLLPWAIRNRVVLGRWIPLDTNSGFTLYDGFNPGATGASDQIFTRQMPQLQSMDELRRSDYLASQAWQYIAEHPSRVAWLAVAKLARTWSPITLSSEYGQLRYRLVAAAFAIPFDLLIIAGLFSGEMSVAAKAFLLTPAIYFSIVHALTVGSLRYRIPAEPPLAILAGVALVSILEKMRSRPTFTNPAQPSTC